MSSRPLQILWASPYVPYEAVGHAGGKSHNYFVKSIASDPRFHVTLISFGQANEQSKHDLAGTSIDHRLGFLPLGRLAKAWRGLTLFLPFSRFGQFFRYPQFRPHLRMRLKELRAEGYRPDVMLLEWTQLAFFQDWFRRAFPNVPVVVYEHDIAFQSARRHLTGLSAPRRLLARLQLSCLERAELKTLHQADAVVVHNVKDRGLLIREAGVSDALVRTIPLYYEDYSRVVPDPGQPHLVFWGAMSRPENHLSILAFLRGPWKLIRNRHPELKIYVVGGGPPEALRAMACDKVIVTDYVNDPAEYFLKTSIMVAPLLVGGGLKVKVLESMSAGLAVVGNEIAMEGIGAEDGVHYLHAESDDEFVESVSRLVSDFELRRQLGAAGREFVLRTFDFREGLSRLGDLLVELAGARSGTL